MTDHFVALDQPRRPWLEGAAVKEAYHRLSASLHPDVPGTGDAARFAALNAAFAILKDPATRLRHLIELGGGSPPRVAAVPPPDLGDLFMALAIARRRLDEHLAKRSAASSPLLRAMLAGDEAALRHELEAIAAKLGTAEAAALDELRRLDAAWPDVDPARLAALAERLTYLSRWIAQSREALFALAA